MVNDVRLPLISIIYTLDGCIIHTFYHIHDGTDFIISDECPSTMQDSIHGDVLAIRDGSPFDVILDGAAFNKDNPYAIVHKIVRRSDP